MMVLDGIRTAALISMNDDDGHDNNTKEYNEVHATATAAATAIALLLLLLLLLLRMTMMVMVMMITTR
jgi:hypothetical protein